jgi:hypothetical protein
VVVAAPVSGAYLYRVHFPGGLSLEVGQGFVAQELEELCVILQRV